MVWSGKGQGKVREIDFELVVATLDRSAANARDVRRGGSGLTGTPVGRLDKK